VTDDPDDEALFRNAELAFRADVSYAIAIAEAANRTTRFREAAKLRRANREAARVSPGE
jgi:hypothetical protein